MKSLLLYLNLILSISTFFSLGAVAADIHIVSSGKSDRMILFVHGILGDPLLTFKNDNAPFSWPEMVARDTRPTSSGPPLSDYAVAVLKYDAAIETNLSLDQLSNQIRTALIDGGALNYKYIFVITHSMGGLIAKRLLIDLKISDSSKFEKFVSVMLIAVPSQGAPAADLVNSLPNFLSGLLKPKLAVDIATLASNTYLQALETQWQLTTGGRRSDFPMVFCAFETRPIYGTVIVPQTYTSTRCDNVPLAVDRDHISIVKPISTDDIVYDWVRSRIVDVSSRLPVPSQANSNVSVAQNASFTVKIPGRDVAKNCYQITNKLSPGYSGSFEFYENAIKGQSISPGAGEVYLICLLSLPSELKRLELSLKKVEVDWGQDDGAGGGLWVGVLPSPPDTEEIIKRIKAEGPGTMRLSSKKEGQRFRSLEEQKVQVGLPMNTSEVAVVFAFRDAWPNATTVDFQEAELIGFE